MKLLSQVVNWYFSRNALPYWCILIIDFAIIICSGILSFYLVCGGDAIIHHVLCLNGDMYYDQRPHHESLHNQPMHT